MQAGKIHQKLTEKVIKTYCTRGIPLHWNLAYHDMDWAGACLWLALAVDTIFGHWSPSPGIGMMCDESVCLCKVVMVVHATIPVMSQAYTLCVCLSLMTHVVDMHAWLVPVVCDQLFTVNLCPFYECISWLKVELNIMYCMMLAPPLIMNCTVHK